MPGNTVHLSEDKELRMKHIGDMIAKVRMRRHYLRLIVHFMTFQAEYDVYLLSELWMRPDHETIRLRLPPGNNHDLYDPLPLGGFFSQTFHIYLSGYFMTEVGDFALPTCDGRVLPSFCSGLAIVSRYPFIEVRLTWSNATRTLCKQLSDI